MLKINLTISTSPRDILATCSSAITDKLAIHATCRDHILQPELPPHLPDFGTPPPPRFMALLVNPASWWRLGNSSFVTRKWISCPLLCSTIHGSLWGGKGTESIPDCVLPMFCLGFPFWKGGCGRASFVCWNSQPSPGRPLTVTLAQILFWAKNELGLGFSILTQLVWGGWEARGWCEDSWVEPCTLFSTMRAFLPISTSKFHCGLASWVVCVELFTMTSLFGFSVP